jgi:hypothetical protein
MSLIIKSGATSDLLTVDPTSKAGRVTLYSTTGQAITSLPVTPTPASDVLVNGTISANGANISVSTQGSSAVVFNVTGTWVGTLQPQYQLADNSWVNGSVFPTLPSGVSVSTITANGQWKTNTGGFQAFRLLSTAWTSGTATINLEASAGQTFLQILLKGASGQTLDGTAGTPSTGVVTVQGVAGGTAVPVSLSGSIAIVGTDADNATNSTTKVPVIPARANAAAPTWTEGREAPLSVDLTGNLRTAISGSLPAGSNVIGHVITDSGSTTVVTGTVTTTQGTANTNANGWPVKITDGTNVLGTIANPVEVSIQSEGPTASPVPIQAIYTGFNTAGNLVGVSTANPLPVTSSSSDTFTSSTALGSLNATIQVALQGQNSAGFQLAAGTLIGTIIPEISYDGGTTWNAVQFIDPVRSSYFNNYIFPSSPNAATAASIDTSGGVTHARVRVSAFTSGTANAVMNASKVARGSTTVTQIDGQKSTYRSTARAFAAIASATAVSPTWTIQGSATKIIRITRIHITATAGTGVVSEISLARFTTPFSGGTVGTTPTIAKDDTNDPTPTAIVQTWSAVNTTATFNPGGAYLAADKYDVFTASATLAIPTLEWTFGDKPGTRAITLRGTSDWIGVITIAAGTTPSWDIWVEWTEE